MPLVFLRHSHLPAPYQISCRLDGDFDLQPAVVSVTCAMPLPSERHGAVSMCGGIIQQCCSRPSQSGAPCQHFMISTETPCCSQLYLFYLGKHQQLEGDRKWVPKDIRTAWPKLNLVWIEWLCRHRSCCIQASASGRCAAWLCYKGLKLHRLATTLHNAIYSRQP